VKYALEFVSLGKHNSGLYSEGRVFQSTSYGGLITLALAGVILALSIVTLIGVVHQERVDTIIKTTTEEYKRFNVSIYDTIGQLEI
jgi:hypothetical protein